jgi:hypothetical protein
MEQKLLQAYLFEDITPQEYDMMSACVRQPLDPTTVERTVQYLREDMDGGDKYKYWKLVYRTMLKKQNPPAELMDAMQEWMNRMK